MNLRNTEKIKPGAYYTFAQINKEFGLSTYTLWMWRKKGRLVCMSNRPSMCTGQRLLWAIENRSMPS